MRATPNSRLVRILAHQALLTICATCKRAENRWLKGWSPRAARRIEFAYDPKQTCTVAYVKRTRMFARAASSSRRFALLFVAGCNPVADQPVAIRRQCSDSVIISCDNLSVGPRSNFNTRTINSALARNVWQRCGLFRIQAEWTSLKDGLDLRLTTVRVIWK